MTAEGEAVLFLGSGATNGSGIKKQGEPLPTDRDFFKSSSVRKLLDAGTTAYPCLRIFREEFLKAGCFAEDKQSLFYTWDALFIFRGLIQSGIIDLTQMQIEEFRKVFNRDWPSSYEFQKEHYRHQFNILDGRPEGYFLAELAIWDLRVLIKDVYGDLDNANDNNEYKDFWEGINERVTISAVVNLNYDTTFDDLLCGSFYYPGDNSSSSRGKKPLIRPHGSLKWKNVGKMSTTQKRFTGWISTFENVDLKNMGYKTDPHGLELQLEQPLIVPPSSFKEEVVGNSSLPGLTDSILRSQWQKLYEVARAAEHWIFYGFSFASGDNHLKLLLQSLFSGQKIHCQDYADKNQTPKNLKQFFGVDICRHKIPKGKPKEFLEHKECELFKVKLLKGPKRVEIWS